jgi:hypothetical protein
VKKKSASVGYLVVKRLHVFSHIAELPTLCANAGLERRPIRGVSNLPLKQLIHAQTIQMAADEAAQARADRIAAGGSLDDEVPVVAEDAFSLGGSTDVISGGAFSSDVMTSLQSARVHKNIYKGLHFIRCKAKNKFYQSLLPVRSQLMEDRQLAMLMGTDRRLGADSDIQRFLFASPIFDAHLIPFIWTFLTEEPQKRNATPTLK